MRTFFPALRSSLKTNLLALLLALFAALPVSAATLTTLFSFTGGASAKTPIAGLVEVSDGVFFGTTYYGGTNGKGTVYKITSSGILTILVSFNGTNGTSPKGTLVKGSDGSFYGTTIYGGLEDAGTVFKISPEGIFTTLHNFKFDITQGYYPNGTLIEGSDGAFYGTTYYGGPSDMGTVFKITPQGHLTTLLNFIGTNGENPVSTLVEGSDGALYGNTSRGGTNGKGTVFKVTLEGAQTILFNFNGTNGEYPNTALVEGNDGVFYGTAAEGGANGGGTVFKITSKGAFTTLVNFDGTNGYYPLAGLVEGSDGAFYGTTSHPQTQSDDTIFKITPEGVFTKLLSIGGGSGAAPVSSFTLASDGLFYGTTQAGGVNGLGTVFKLIAAPQPQTITFPAITSKAIGSTFNLIATASSGLPVSFKVLSGPATISGQVVTITAGTGTVKLQASQAGDENYSAATSVTQSFAVTKKTQKISFPGIARQYYGVPSSPGAKASSGLAVSYVVVSGPATVLGDKLIFSGLGRVVVQGVQAGDSVYAAAPVAKLSFTVIKGTQKITLAKVADQVVGAAPITLKGTASTGLPVTYKVRGPATVSGNVVTITGAGTVQVVAYQTGNSLYSAAPVVNISFKVSKLTQKITFPAVGFRKVGETVTLAASSTSGLPLTYSANGPVTFSGNKATFTAAGLFRITASQPGDATYAGAAPVTVSVRVR